MQKFVPLSHKMENDYDEVKAYFEQKTGWTLLTPWTYHSDYLP
jgi:hypothetical protein